MTFRWISGDELERLEPIMAAQGWTPTDPTFSKALIVEDEEGNLLGFNLLQAILRPEPIWVDERFRGAENGDLAMQMAEKMAEHLVQAGAVYWEIRARNPFVERLCLANGMHKIESPMYAGGVE